VKENARLSQHRNGNGGLLHIMCSCRLLANLHADRKLIIRAAAQAQRACDYILNVNGRG
jgi:antirestriction protein ArdC